MNDLLNYVNTHRAQLAFDSLQHVSTVLQSVFFAAIAAVIIGVLVYRYRTAADLANAGASTIFTIPAFALLGLLIPIFGLGIVPSVIVLALYSLLPILRNTVVGLSTIDPAAVDAAKGVGMTRIGTLLRVEFPLVWPSILSGIRVSTQMAMGVLAIAAYAKGPGLGNLIFTGLARVGSPTAIPMALTGTVLIVILALALDGLLQLLGRLTTSKGIR